MLIINKVKCVSVGRVGLTKNRLQSDDFYFRFRFINRQTHLLSLINSNIEFLHAMIELVSINRNLFVPFFNFNSPYAGRINRSNM